MSDEDALLTAIAAHPEEDTPRLMYADWLDEHGQPVRAEFIRGQIEIAQKEHLPRVVLNRYVSLFQRNQELIDNHRAELLGPLAGLPGKVRIEFHRGFVSEVMIRLTHLCSHYDEIRVAFPFPRIILADDISEVQSALGFLVGIAHYPGCEDVVAALRTVPGHRSGRFAGALDPFEPPIGHRPSELDPFEPRVWLRLEELDISGCQLGDELVAKLLRESALPVLSDLDLSGNGLTDVAIDSLLNSSLPPQLTRLILGGNDITDAGAVALADGWPSGDNDRLEALNLRFTHIGQTGQRALLDRFGGRIDLF
jgi:uncharacterized protein (TIGR02996 family)